MSLYVRASLERSSDTDEEIVIVFACCSWPLMQTCGPQFTYIEYHIQIIQFLVLTIVDPIAHYDS